MAKRLLTVLIWIIGLAILAVSLFFLFSPIANSPLILEGLSESLAFFITISICATSFIAWIICGLDTLCNYIVGHQKPTEDKEDEQPQPDPDRQVLTVFDQNSEEIYSRANVFYYDSTSKDGITTITVNYLTDPDDEETSLCDTIQGPKLSSTFQQIDD